MTPLHFNPFSLLLLSSHKQKGRFPHDVHFFSGQNKAKEKHGTHFTDLGIFFLEYWRCGILPRFHHLLYVATDRQWCGSSVIFCLEKKWRSFVCRTVAGVELPSSDTLKEKRSEGVLEEEKPILNSASGNPQKKGVKIDLKYSEFAFSVFLESPRDFSVFVSVCGNIPRLWHTHFFSFTPSSLSAFKPFGVGLLVFIFLLFIYFSICLKPCFECVSLPSPSQPRCQQALGVSCRSRWEYGHEKDATSSVHTFSFFLLIS